MPKNRPPKERRSPGPIRATTVLSFGSFLVLGLPTGALGVAWPSVRASLGLPLTDLGVLLAAMTASYFTAASLTGALHDRLGTVRLIVACAAAGAAGLLVFGAATGLPTLVIAALLVGAGAGPIDGAVNAHVALTRGVRSMGLLHASWALGAALGPGLVGLALALTGSWRPAYAAMALLYVALGAAVWGTRAGWRIGAAEPAARRGPRLPRTLLLMLVALVLYGGLEVSAGQWSFSALTAGGLDALPAGWSVSLYWAALAGGRLALGLGGGRFAPMRLLDLSVAGGIAGTLAFALLPPPAAGLIALPLVGLALSVFFPLLIFLTPGRLGPAAATRAIGYQAAAGTVGGTFLPGLVGVAISVSGLGVLGPALVLLALGLGLFHLTTRGVAAPH